MDRSVIEDTFVYQTHSLIQLLRKSAYNANGNNISAEAVSLEMPLYILLHTETL